MASEDRTQLPLGEALIQEGVITEGQLAQAAERLKQDQENGRTTTLTGTLTTLGMASDKAILTAINKVYGLGATALTPDIDERIERLGTGGLFGRVRVPISIKLSVTLAVFLLSVMMVLSYFMLKRQAENLYAESVKSGKISLKYFTTEAKIPLLNDDTLRLNSLISEVTQVEGLVYAVIAGRDGIIKAHNDLSQVGKPLVLAGREGPVSKEEDGSSYFTRRLLDGTEILNLTAPVSFKGKALGEVHVGISLDFIADRISKEKVFIYMMTVVFFLIGMAVAGLLGTNFSRPISRLVVATREISNGNYHHKVDFKRKDEFDDLGRAFNYMSHELWLKSIMRESFGRYVSTTIRDLILADPESVLAQGYQVRGDHRLRRRTRVHQVLRVQRPCRHRRTAQRILRHRRQAHRAPQRLHRQVHRRRGAGRVRRPARLRGRPQRQRRARLLGHAEGAGRAGQGGHQPRAGARGRLGEHGRGGFG